MIVDIYPPPEGAQMSTISRIVLFPAPRVEWRARAECIYQTWDSPTRPVRVGEGQFAH
jgi:hypothetical protein